jgi:hypothetical protein
MPIIFQSLCYLHSQIFGILVIKELQRKYFLSIDYNPKRVQYRSIEVNEFLQESAELSKYFGTFISNKLIKVTDRSVVALCVESKFY